MTVGEGVATATNTGTPMAATTVVTLTAIRIHLRMSCSFTVAAWNGAVVPRTRSGLVTTKWPSFLQRQCDRITIAVELAGGIDEIAGAAG